MENPAAAWCGTQKMVKCFIKLNRDQIRWPPVVQRCGAIDALHAVVFKAESASAESVCLIHNEHLQGRCQDVLSASPREDNFTVFMSLQAKSSRSFPWTLAQESEQRAGFEIPSFPS